MKFKFTYERLLEYYHQQERIARRDFNESLGRLEVERQKQQRLYQQFDEAIAELYDLRESRDGAEVARLQEIEIFLKGQEIRIVRQREIIINHTQIVEQKQEILIAAAKESEIFIKLKEKRLKEFKITEKKTEAKNNDELVVTRFRRGEGL